MAVSAATATGQEVLRSLEDRVRFAEQLCGLHAIRAEAPLGRSLVTTLAALEERLKPFVSKEYRSVLELCE